jgi:hypothetical protein
LDSALLRINVSSHALLLLTFFVSNQPAIAAIVEHSQGKDKLLISSLKKIYEAQDLEDELNQDIEAELQTLKAMAENVVVYFYPQDSDTASRTPELMDMLLTKSREVIASNLRKASSLTLGILKSLYPKVDLDAAGEGFMATCSKGEATNLV